MSRTNQAASNNSSTKRRKLSNGEHYNPQSEKPSSRANAGDIPEPEGQQPVAAPSNGPSKAAQRSKSSPALPTGGLNKASLLTVQLTELLAESTPRYDSRIASIDQELERIRHLIQDVPKTEPLSLKDAESLVAKADVSIPFPAPKPGKDTNLKFGYDSPGLWQVKSALHLRMGIKGSEVVKIILEMPKDLLQEKDYLNYRAFHKRAFYLARIAAHIKTVASDEFELHYTLENGVESLPTLMMTSKHQSTLVQRRYTVIVVVSFPEEAFPLEKTLPTKNCVRPTGDSDLLCTQPTPTYNSILNSQMTLGHYDRVLQTAIKQCPAFADACRAGQIWLKKRGFDSDIDSGGFGFWEWATMLALLLQTGGHKGHAHFPERCSMLQLFKAMLQILAGRDMTNPWILNAVDLPIPRSDIPYLYDGNTSVNILQKMTSSSYQVLKHHARISLETVNSRHDDAFEATFDTRENEPQLQFDEMYSIVVSRSENPLPSNRAQFLSKLFRVLKQGLGDRVTLLDLRLQQSQPWSTTRPQPRMKESTVVELRLLLNMDITSRLIDHGPSADDQAAAEGFRRFWGEKSELRRFIDGSISESLVWSLSTPVTQQIIAWLLERHFRASKDSLTCNSPKLDDQRLEVDFKISAAEAFRLINSQFQSLSSTLHHLEGLPLSIRSISPADPALGSSTLSHPLSPNNTAPISVLVQFDSSTRWPDSLPAIQHTKIAFLLKAAELISTSNSSLVTRVGLENTTSQHTGYLNTSFLDIIYPPPHSQLAHITFRLRIHHDRELPLLQAQISKSLSPTERSQATSALTAYKRTLAGLLHTTTFRTLTTRFPPLSPTIRLLKSFLSAHHLSNLIPSELIELIVAHIFLHPSPWASPGSASTAFLRCLHFLARWDWQVTPLIIDLSLSQDMSHEARDELKTRFSAWRKLDPQMNNVSWFVGTSIDGTGVVWDEGGRVEKVVVGRMRTLAAAVMEVVREKGMGMGERDWRKVFRGETGQFDFVIRLDKSVVVGVQQGKKGKWKEKEQPKFKNLVLAQQSVSTDDIGFDPVALYLEDLHKAFGHVALFFHGECQDVICGLWRPNVAGEREWRVRMGWSGIPVRYEKAGDGEGEEKKVLCTINKDGILAEAAMLGEGLVKDIKLKSQD